MIANKILMVDDGRSKVMTLAEELQELGIKAIEGKGDPEFERWMCKISYLPKYEIIVDYAYSIFHGLKEVKDKGESYLAIISDLQMPLAVGSSHILEDGGIQFLQKLREFDKQTPVILYSDLSFSNIKEVPDGFENKGTDAGLESVCRALHKILESSNKV